MTRAESLPDDIAGLKALVLAERAARRTAQVEIEMLKLQIAKLRREQYGVSSERSARLIEQLELELSEREETVAAQVTASEIASPAAVAVRSFHRQKPARCPRICRASAWCMLLPPPARVAAARCASSART